MKLMLAKDFQYCDYVFNTMLTQEKKLYFIENIFALGAATLSTIVSMHSETRKYLEFLNLKLKQIPILLKTLQFEFLNWTHIFPHCIKLMEFLIEYRQITRSLYFTLILYQNKPITLLFFYHLIKVCFFRCLSIVYERSFCS